MSFESSIKYNTVPNGPVPVLVEVCNGLQQVRRCAVPVYGQAVTLLPNTCGGGMDVDAEVIFQVNRQFLKIRLLQDDLTMDAQVW